MNPHSAAHPRMLVIANRTCPCPTLVHEVARRAHDRVELAVGEMRERGLIENARARFDIPIIHLVSSYGLVEEGVPA